jgi:SPFH domain / Band 7 family
MSQNILLLILSTAVVFALLSIKRIPEGTVYTLRRFNGQARTLQSGTHLIWPLLERVVHRISLSGHVLPLDELFPMQRGSARLSGKIYWQVLDAARADALIDRADELIRARALNAARAVEDPAQESNEARNSRLKAVLNDNLREVGIVVTRVQIALA